MRENYRPWHVNIEDFPREGSLEKQLEFLLRFAILAPSGHNSQPWEFSIGRDSIMVFANKERSLEKSDPESRQILIGVGCSIENILIAADYYGFNTRVEYFPEKDKQRFVAGIYLNKDSKWIGDNNHLIFEILKRRTNRNKYYDKKVPHELIKEFSGLSNNKIKVSVITDQEKRHALALLANTSQIEVMDDDSFREELSNYIKHNFTKSKTGMPGFTLGIPTPVSLFASKLIRKINLSRKTYKKDEKLLKNFTHAFIVISTVTDTNVDWLNAGRVFEKLWLISEREGLQCAPLAAPVQVGEYYKKVQHIIDTKYRPVIFSRIGYCNKIPKHSPRLSIKDVLIHKSHV